VHQGTRSQTLYLREFAWALRYNSPDCPVHTGLSGVPAEQRLLHAQRSTATAFNALATVRAEVRARAGGAPDSPEGPQVRAPTVEPQRLADVAGAPDCPVRHATAHFQCPSFGGWGYKYPNHPTFNGIQVSTLLHLTRASIQYKTHQRDQILFQLHTKL
jgi:hypothetical protein